MNDKTTQIHNNRPLSPHLTIYKPQISSILSITHRLSGFALYIGMICFAWLISWVVFDPEVVNCSCLKSDLFKIVLFVWTMALFFHFLNGIRHLFWDAGQGFDIPTMNRSGILVLIGSIILSLTCWYLALANI
jgi:succinate dehydrogenase / fumarate reductase cytochrome b subunit